jgi:WD40 repeat protein
MEFGRLGVLKGMLHAFIYIPPSLNWAGFLFTLNLFLTYFLPDQTFEGHTNSILRVNFLSRGTQLLSAGSDGLVKLWSIRSEECVTTLDAHEDKVYRSPQISCKLLNLFGVGLGLGSCA